MGDLLPPGKMIPAQSMGKHDRRTAPGALVVDLGARVLNKAARNGGWVSVCGRLFFLRLPAGSYQRASSGEGGELREVTTCDHGSQINSAIRSRPILGPNLLNVYRQIQQLWGRVATRWDDLGCRIRFAFLRLTKGAGVDF